MTEVLHSPSNLPSSPSSLLNHDGNILQTQTQTQTQIIINQISEGETENNDTKEREEELSLLTLLIAVFRKSLVVCKTDRKDLCSMEIGWPTNVRHVTHVTFDRFNGFLGLPDEFEPEVPRRAPSASTTVFGVSTESMQLSYDSRGNSVPTILLLMQRRLYAQGGLRYEGVFRINAENSQEEYVRDQLNRGIVPDGIDVHCLAGLIKAWFRELPTGVLDSLSPEQVMQCQSEEDCVQLAKLLPPTEAALLDWAVNLMCDVVQEEQQNKMNARNVAMVFAPNMTQMADPLTALMYAVQVMNFLRNLITKTLRERQDSATKPATVDTHFYPPDRKDPENPPYPSLITFSKEETDLESIADKPSTENCTFLHEDNFVRPNLELNFEPATTSDNLKKGTKLADNSKVNARRSKLGQSSHWSSGKSSRKMNTQAPIHVRAEGVIEKEKGISLVSRINSRVERVEAWR